MESLRPYPTVGQMVDEGYTVIQDEVSIGLTNEIRNHIIEQVEKDSTVEIQFRTNMHQACHSIQWLYHDLEWFRQARCPARKTPGQRAVLRMTY